MSGSGSSRKSGGSGASPARVPATRKPPRDLVQRVEVIGDLDAHAVEELTLEVRRLVRRYGRRVTDLRIAVSAAGRKDA